MDPTNLDEARLSQIATHWSRLIAAHQASPEAAGAAQLQLIQRYSPAVYRYLLGAVRNEEAADELFQEFALRFVRGDFRRADPQRGRFRDFLKTTLYHLVVDYQRRKGKPTPPLQTEPAAGATPPPDADADFHALWRGLLLARAWEALERVEKETGQPLHTVLRFRANHPEVKSPEMAEQLAPVLGKAVTAHWVRNRLVAAREKFTNLVLDELARTVENPTLAELEQEALDLGLHEYCRDALEQRRRGG